MPKRFKIVLITGTTRPGNRSQYVAKKVSEIISSNYPEMEVIEVSPLDYNITEGNQEANNNPEWVKLNKTVDGYIIITPEYNHAFPGSLKMLLDDDFNYEHKPVGLVGVSDGPWGGARAIEALLHVLKATGMIMIRRDAHMTWVRDNITETGEWTIPEKSMAKFTAEVEGMLKEFSSILHIIGEKK